MWSLFKIWRWKKRNLETLAAMKSIQSELNRYREMLAIGSKMRQQTPKERETNPTTFGYARFQLTDEERACIQRMIEFYDGALRRVQNREPIRWETTCNMYMDGGSLSITYDRPDLFCRCTLFFKIRWNPEDLAGRPHIRQFTHAELWEEHQFQWTSKIVGVTYDDSFKSTLDVSWETARQILKALAPQVTGSDRRIFDEMIEIANSDGMRPPSPSQS